MVDKIRVINCGGYFTIVNESYYAKRKHHCHFNNKNHANTIKDLVEKKKVPRSNYFKKSALRLTINNEYKLNLLDSLN